MLIKIVPCEDYFDLTHDICDDEEFNDPEDLTTWDWHGPEDTYEKPCSINGSPYLSVKSVGYLIKLLVVMAKMGEVSSYGYADLREAVNVIDL